LKRGLGGGNHITAREEIERGGQRGGRSTSRQIEKATAIEFENHRTTRLGKGGCEREKQIRCCKRLVTCRDGVREGILFNRGIPEQWGRRTDKAKATESA